MPKFPKIWRQNVYSGNIWYRNRKWLVVRAVLPDIDVDFAKNCPLWHFFDQFLAKSEVDNDSAFSGDG